MAKDYKFQVLLLGEPYVGCTSISMRLCEGIFMSNPLTTLGFGFKSRAFNLNDKKVHLQICDSNRSERFLSTVTTKILQDRIITWDAIVLVYDVTNETSFSAIQKWFKYAQENVNSNSVEMMILANKSDLQDQRQVSFDRGQQLALELNINGFMEISAKSGHNVEEAFKFTLLANHMTKIEN